MPDTIPSVNQDPAAAADSEGGTMKPFVDPLHEEIAPALLADEIELTAEEVAANKADQTEINKMHGKVPDGPSVEQLKEIAGEETDDKDKDDKKADEDAGEAEKAKEDDDEAKPDDEPESEKDDKGEPQPRGSNRTRRRALEREAVEKDAEIANLKQKLAEKDEPRPKRAKLMPKR